MKTRFSVLSLGLLLGLGLYSCSSTEEEFIPEEQQVEIKLTSAILTPETRGANASEQSTQIVSGQSVGVTIANASAAHNNVQWNVGTNGTLTSTSSSPIYYGTTAATITAYHPYNEAWSTLGTQQFSVLEDQSAEGYKNSDLLWTTKTQERTAGNVSLVFAHKLAKVNVNLTSSTFTDTELATATISIASVELNTGIDLSTGALSAATTSNVGEIVAAKNSATAYAIVVPQTVASGKVLIKVKLGSAVYGYTLPSNVTFAAGTSYTYNMTLTKHEVKLDSSSITDWTAGTTTDVTGEELAGDSHEYVDLGLSVYWATCNVGATQPSDVGSRYSFTNLTTVNGGNIQTADDPARAEWGGTWRMPTKEEFAELISGCNLTKEANGFRFTSKTNSNSIFLPLTGVYSSKGTLVNSDDLGAYWSSTFGSESNSLFFLQLSKSFTPTYEIISGATNGSLRIRPVFK